MRINPTSADTVAVTSRSMMESIWLLCPSYHCSCHDEVNKVRHSKFAHKKTLWKLCSFCGINSLKIIWAEGTMALLMKRQQYSIISKKSLLRNDNNITKYLNAAASRLKYRWGLQRPHPQPYFLIRCAPNQSLHDHNMLWPIRSSRLYLLSHKIIYKLKHLIRQSVLALTTHYFLAQCASNQSMHTQNRILPISSARSHLRSPK